MSKNESLDDAEFKQLEESIRESERGNWFLNEFSKKTFNRELKRLGDEVQGMQQNIMALLKEQMIDSLLREINEIKRISTKVCMKFEDQSLGGISDYRNVVAVQAFNNVKQRLDNIINVHLLPYQGQLNTQNTTGDNAHDKTNSNQYTDFLDNGDQKDDDLALHSHQMPHDNTNINFEYTDPSNIQNASTEINRAFGQNNISQMMMRPQTQPQEQEAVQEYVFTSNTTENTQQTVSDNDNSEYSSYGNTEIPFAAENTATQNSQNTYKDQHANPQFNTSHQSDYSQNNITNAQNNALENVSTSVNATRNFQTNQQTTDNRQQSYAPETAKQTMSSQGKQADQEFLSMNFNSLSKDQAVAASPSQNFKPSTQQALASDNNKSEHFNEQVESGNVSLKNKSQPENNEGNFNLQNFDPRFQG